ncbi:glycosyltransferase [Allocoprobacillus halotolerans]|uniref:glycosyltransferase n=1 Tax=Allocoprobacillus halotolerans TaxID=2944914 RepID=UPI00338DC77B
MERYGAKYTDTLITINKEDYAAANNFKLRKNGTVEYVPGVGINIDKISSIQGNKEELCKELNIPSDSTLLLSVGELNDNKNHKVIIQSLPELPSNVHYVICGRGPLKEQHEQLAKELHVENRLHLLGYRSDVIKIMKSCDIFVFPSKREGLSVALMEAMACGLPCIASRIRGNIDLITQGTNSILCNPNGYMNFVDVIISIDEEIKDKFSKLNIIESKKYSVKQISEKMKKMYLKGDIFHD